MFMEKLEDALNTSTTENGAVGFATTKSKILDFSYKVSSYRNSGEQTIIRDFAEAWGENPELALKLLFYIRDIREGNGERRLFRVCMSYLLEKQILATDEQVVDVLNWISIYGRYDDMEVFFDTKYEEVYLKYVATLLNIDLERKQNNSPVSLLAKWLPTPGSSSKDSDNKAKKIYKYMAKTITPKMNERAYRKMLATLREYLNNVESKMTARKWDEIKYEAVPSLANLRYNTAFYKHDEKRRKEYLEKLRKGETKINASVSTPHEIVTRYKHFAKEDTAFEEMWKNLKDTGSLENFIVVRDGSGSMNSSVGNSSTTCLDVSTALAFYFGERCKGDYKDKFITFSSRPELVDFSKLSTLHEKLLLAEKYYDCSNTNIQKVFDLILSVAVENKIPQEEIPNILIVSDMEFDNATYVGEHSNDDKLFTLIGRKWAEAGYKLPKLIFWNICSRSGTIPVTLNENGVILISGFSPTAIQAVYTGELDPYKALLKVLNSERYERVKL